MDTGRSTGKLEPIVKKNYKKTATSLHMFKSMKFTSIVKMALTPVAALLVLAGCYNDKEDQLYPEPPTGNTCDTAAMSYATHIKPITDQYCATASCHNSSVIAGGYDMSSYAGLKLAVTNNRLVGVINHANGFSPMPQGMSKLTDCNINKITAWVNQGALDN